MSAPAQQPDWTDVQRLVAFSYTLERCRHFVLQVVEPELARDFLAGLLATGLITNASIRHDEVKSRKDRSGCPVNIGFTFRGLRQLGLPQPWQAVFQEKARAYAEGAYLRAAARLADTGASAAPWWQECFRPERAHVLLSVYADTERELEQFCAALRGVPGAAGLDGWNPAHDGCHLYPDKEKRTVHFGLRDGISNPQIKGLHTCEPAPKSCAAGEFVLGYENDEEFNPWLLLSPRTSPNPWLLPTAPIDPAFFRNGSFAAFRKIQQHVDRFDEFVSEWAARRRVSEDYIKAKLVGRWPDGSVLQPGQIEAPKSPIDSEGRPTVADLNNFDFSDDAQGKGCPFGAHIRRLNPRADPVVPFRRRLLARRGMPYGPSDESDKKDERGLLGLFFCASLEDQFEHLLGQWANANPMGPDNRGNAKDPLIGNHENRRAVFDIPTEDDHSNPLHGFMPFVTTRGTLYAFYPGLAALGMIASLKPPSCDEA